MATPNYGYEKRQKELAKKRKKEEKVKAKADRRLAGPDDKTDATSASGPMPDSDGESGEEGNLPTAS